MNQALSLVLGLLASGVSMPPDTTSRITAWDLFIACRALPLPHELGAICAAQVPRRGGYGVDTWHRVLESPPSTDIVIATRDAVMREYARQADNLSVAVLRGLMLHFDSASTVLTPGQIDSIHQIVPDLQSYLAAEPTRVLSIRGSADHVGGSSDGNQRIARRRAEVVKQVLVRAGVDSTRVQATHAVDLAPARNATAQARGLRRHAVLSAAPDVLLAAPPSRPTTSTNTLGVPDMTTRIVIGTADFLVQRAKEEAAQYLIEAAGDELCRRYREYLVQTCQHVYVFFQRDKDKTPQRSDTVASRRRENLAEDNGGYELRMPVDTVPAFRPGLSFVSNALLSDLSDLPYQLVMKGIDARLNDGVTENLYTAALALMLYRSVVAGSPLTTAFAEAAGHLAKKASISGPWAVRLAMFGTLSRYYDDALHDFASWDHGTVPDTLSLYSVRALTLNAVNGSEGTDMSRHIRGDIRTAVESYMAFLADIATLAQQSRQRAQMANGSMSNELQRQSVAELIAMVDNIILGTVRDLSQSNQGALGVYVASRNLAQAVARAHYTEATHAALRLSAQFRDEPLIGHQQARLLALASDLAAADDADDINRSLQRFTNRAGGYREKRVSGRSFTRLNAYFGIGGGLERVRVPAPGDDVRKLEAAFLYAPIGVEFGVAKGYSHSLFMQFVDLGAIATLRYGMESEEDIPRITLESIVAPGIFYVLGLNSKPLAVGVGASILPRALEGNTGVRRAIRVGLSWGSICRYSRSGAGLSEANAIR